MLINPSQSYGNFFNIYPDDGTANTLSLFSTAIANGYPYNGINNGKTQYERNVTYFSRESKYIFQYYANVTGGQSGGPLYIKFNNIYYVIGILTGNNASGINFSVNYNSSLLNLFNFIKNGG